jgi:hypothetical protein
LQRRSNLFRSCSQETARISGRSVSTSEKVEVESDKINYIISSVFLLSNRLAKASIGLAELDNAIATDSEKIDKAVSTEILKTILDKIIAEYF